MNSAEFDELVKSRRSIRSFNDTPVNRDEVLEIIETAVFAPSANNRQGWKFYCVASRSKIESMADEVSRVLLRTSGRSEVVDEMMEGYSANFTVFRNAPTILACCYVKPAGFNFRVFETDEENRHFTGELISVSMAMQNILLLAEARGLGSLVLTAPLIGAREIKKILGIPGKYTIAAFICLGHCDSRPPMPGRKRGEAVTVFVD